MPARPHHVHSLSESVNHRAQLANAYQELGKELASEKIRVVGNYTLGKVIGEGTYGKVRLGIHRLTSTRVAIKQIPKSFSAQLTREIHHHRRLHHPHVTQLYEVIATESSIWLVTELCSGGELFDYLVEKGRITEEETRKIFGQLCLAVWYVHENKAVHRDLKLENVLLDERCNVKLGDFGFTREFEQGRMLDTFCGTTGYAAPEMLLGKKYTGQEVDVWSLGVILYCLLVGTLPFDNDDEDVMRAKIVEGTYEEPDWLSTEVLDLIRNVLQQIPSNRLTIPQILGHPWFTNPPPPPSPSPPHVPSPSLVPLTLTLPPRPSPPPPPSPPERLYIEPVLPSVEVTADPEYMGRSSESTTSAASDATTHSDLSSDRTPPTTPDEEPVYHESIHDAFTDDVPVEDDEEAPIPVASGVRRNESELTLRKWQMKEREKDDVTPRASKVKSITTGSESLFAAVPEEDPPLSAPSTKSNPPSSYPTRTPVRTKRRSVSSNLSAPTSPTDPTPSAHSPAPQSPVEYVKLLSAPAPLAFSTPLERDLLSSLSALGFDTGQIVHSVLTNACDATGAIWWMLKKKAEKKLAREEAEARRVEEERMKALSALQDRTTETPSPFTLGEDQELLERTESRAGTEESLPPSNSVSSTWPSRAAHGPSPLGLESSSTTSLNFSSTPDLSLIPPTPMAAVYPANVSEPHTPPQITSPSASQTFLSVSPILHGTDSSTKSTPATPSSSNAKDKDSKGRSTKPRSGSVSVLQRAAGLVRKKSDEKVREREGGVGQSNVFSADEAPRSSSSSHVTNKLTKSPPPIKERDREPVEHSSLSSPWVFASRNATRPSNLPLQDDTLSPLPNVSKSTISSSGSGSGKGTRNKANLLTAFSKWFDGERRKIKNKSTPPTFTSQFHAGHPGSVSPSDVNAASTSRQSFRGGKGEIMTQKRGKGTGRKRVGHGKRPSVSSRRSSSVNSRRSSAASLHKSNLDLGLVDSTSIPEDAQGILHYRVDTRRRSIGSRTPTSEKGDFSSRPSSVRSFSITPITPGGPKHARRGNNSGIHVRSHSPDTSSAGSDVEVRRTASPLQNYHRRAGSGSSTRVVRQVVHSNSRPRAHIRSNSTTSSIRSLTSSRPGSFHEGSENDAAAGRAGSPSVARPVDERRSRGTTILVAQKKQSPFTAPHHGMYTNMSRSSWKKAWGAEPPGWSSRSTVSPREDTSDSGSRTNIRDVFAGRTSLNLGDDSDWIDEDDDLPAFAGGLGQRPASLQIPPSHLGDPFPPSPLMKKMELPPLPPSRLLTLPTQSKSRQTSNPSASTDFAAASSRLSPIPQSHSYSRDGLYPSLGMHGHTVTEVLSTSPEPANTSTSRTRRQLPTGRNGPAFRHPIQEEDEEEED